MVVQGKLDGDIRASQRAELRKTAVAVGDVFTQRIAIEEGAYFKGKVDIQQEGSKPASVSAVKSEPQAESKSAAQTSGTVAGAGSNPVPPHTSVTKV